MLAFALTITAVIAVIVPVFRRELKLLYQAEGERQADLVETIHGIRAIKSLALEPMRKASGTRGSRPVVRRRWSVGRIGVAANVADHLAREDDADRHPRARRHAGVRRRSQRRRAGGVHHVVGRVTGPLVQIVALINEYQQTALSVKMLGKVMDHPPERDPTSTASGLRSPAGWNSRASASAMRER